MCQRYDGSIYEPPGINVCDRVEQRASDLLAQLETGHEENGEYEALVQQCFEDAADEVHPHREDEEDV